MIVIAPDKFKGTLTAREAARVIASAIPAEFDRIIMPMADGGEGTAQVLCSGAEWQQHDCYYVDRRRKVAVINSSDVIGIGKVSGVMSATSAPLGVKVREILKSGCEKVVIGVGGTGTCDAGTGFLDALGSGRQLQDYRHKIVGLCDVRVPLLAPAGEPSALMFAPQKGATEADMPRLRQRLVAAQARFGSERSPWDGAGGGLGYAIASVLGAECHDGAEYVLSSYDIRWEDVSLVVTGEGSIDRQTKQGKVVETVRRVASAHGVPVVAFGGTVIPEMRDMYNISTDEYLPDQPLTPETAVHRLRQAVAVYFAG